jgi:hypothetical protein
MFLSKLNFSACSYERIDIFKQAFIQRLFPCALFDSDPSHKVVQHQRRERLGDNFIRQLCQTRDPLERQSSVPQQHIDQRLCHTVSGALFSRGLGSSTAATGPKNSRTRITASWVEFSDIAFWQCPPLLEGEAMCQQRQKRPLFLVSVVVFVRVSWLSSHRVFLAAESRRRSFDSFSSGRT